MKPIPVIELDAAQIANPCKGCKNEHGLKSACCQYIILETPTWERGAVCFDTLIWWLTRKGIVVSAIPDKRGKFSDKRRYWTVYLEQTCNYLRPNGMCGNYENRPVICSEYSPFPATHDMDTQEGPGYCERYDPTPDTELKFRSMEELAAFVKQQFGYDYVKHQINNTRYIKGKVRPKL